jgi:hypothetical protein
MRNPAVAKAIRIILFASVIFAAGILCATLGAQTTKKPTSATISGVVTGADTKPVAGAHVYLQPSDGRSPHAVMTDAHGFYIFRGLYQGFYDLRAQHMGRASGWQKNVNVKTGAQVTVNFKLKALPANQPVAPPGGLN